LLRDAAGQVEGRLWGWSEQGRVIWLDTFSFQARPFYERLGFSLFGALAGYPPGSARHFLVKRLE